MKQGLGNMDQVIDEKSRREEMWRQLLAGGGPERVSPTILREIGMYGGAQGIYVDKDRTAPLSPDGSGITVGLLHTSSDYPDELAEDGISYHYPSTNRPPIRDQNEIDATKNAGKLGLPVFVITRPTPSSSIRNVHQGWVEGWDDESNLFLVTFGENPPSQLLLGPTEGIDFEPYDESERPATEISSRPGQHRFRFLVLQRYGQMCSVCNISIPQLLDTAHLIPKSEHGSDDPRNGLVLCALHHRALEAALYGIHPETMVLHFNDKGPTPDDLFIQHDSLNHLRRFPHKDALRWLWDNTFSL